MSYADAIAIISHLLEVKASILTVGIVSFANKHKKRLRKFRKVADNHQQWCREDILKVSKFL